MSQTLTESNPPATDVQPAVFVRMAAVVRMTGLGRSTIYRLRPERKNTAPVGQTDRTGAGRGGDDVCLHALVVGRC